MGSTPFSTTLTSGAKTQSTDDVETFSLVTRGRRNLTVIPDISAEGVGHAYLQSTPSLPLTVVAATNDQFGFGADDGDHDFIVAPGVYTTTAALATALNAATKDEDNVSGAFSTLLTVTAVDSATLQFTSVATGNVTTQFNTGVENDVLAGLGISDTAALAGAGADSAGSITVAILGVDPVSGKTWTMLTGSAITATDTPTPLRVGPGLTAVSNAVANDVLPDTVQVTVTHNDDNAITYTLAAQLAG